MALGAALWARGAAGTWVTTERSGIVIADLPDAGITGIAEVRERARSLRPEAFAAWTRGWIGGGSFAVEHPSPGMSAADLLWVGGAGLPMVWVLGRRDGAPEPTLFQQVEGWGGARPGRAQAAQQRLSVGVRRKQ